MKQTIVLISSLVFMACTTNVNVEPTPPPPTSTEVLEASPSPSTLQSFVNVIDQQAVNAVTVDAANLINPGFIDIHRSVNGQASEIIGVSTLLRGNVRGIRINLTQQVRPGDQLIAMIHRDVNNNGMQEYPGPDIPEVDSAGNPIIDSFVIVE